MANENIISLTKSEQELLLHLINCGDLLAELEKNGLSESWKSLVKSFRPVIYRIVLQNRDK